VSNEHPSGLPAEVVWHRYTRYPFLLARVATIGASVVAVWWVLTAVDAVLFPVFLSLLLAYLLDPAVDWFEARGFDRTTGIGLFIGIGALGVGLFLLFLYPTIQHLLETVVDGVPRLLDIVETQAIPWLEATTGTAMPASWSGLFDQYRDTLQAQLPGLLQRVAKGAGDIWVRTGDVISGALNLVMIPVFTFYFLRDFDRMRLSMVDYLPRHNRDWLLVRIRRMDEVVGAWFRGQVEVAFVLAALYAAGLALTFGISGVGFTTGIAIGLVSGLLNIVPYFGFAIGFGLSVLICLIDWEPWALLGVLATFAVVQGLEGYVITPRIVGEKVGLSPVVVIIALLLGSELLGLLGVLLALPVAGIVRVLLPDVLEAYRASTFYTGELDPALAVTAPSPPAEEAADPPGPPAEAPQPPPSTPDA
jgi:predicted PurR-regulated permease PerM